MVLFVSAVVSSSGMEVAAAFAAWCAGLCIAARTDVPRALAVLTSVSFVVLILSRPISPFNAAAIAVVLATSVGWNRSREILRQRNARPIWIAGLLATLVAGSYILFVGLPSLLGSPENPPLSAAGAVWLTLRLTGQQLRQSVGDFGWLDTPAPGWVVVIWTLVLVGLLAYALVVSPRARRALPLLAVAILAMPVVFESPQINSIGVYWQGRYWLPLLVGLPLVAASVRPRAISRRMFSDVHDQSLRLAGVAALGALLTAAQIAAFLTALHRYETGIGTKPGAAVEWTPPGGAPLVIGLFVAGQVLLVAFLGWEYFHRTSFLPVATSVPASLEPVSS
jgi:hypothetical protein